VAACADKNLQLCEQTCKDKGCFYNNHPVYSALECPWSQPAPPPPPLPPKPPSMPSTSIPDTGIAILDGRGFSWDVEKDVLFCLWPGDEHVTTSEGILNLADPLAVKLRNKRIAAQCCKPPDVDDKDSCRRRAKPDGGYSEDNDDCIAGVYNKNPSQSTFVEMTYGEAVAACADKNLQLCEQTCKDEGCWYNSQPVYTSLACPEERP